jgi:hypothetical protein
VPANDGGSPLIRTSEYIANSPRVLEHLWLFADMAPELRFHGWWRSETDGSVEPLGDWMGTGGRRPSDGAARRWLP